MKPYIQGELLVQHMSILRNKQCMLAYLMGRVQLLQSLRWELSTESIPDEVMECLSPQEKQFREDYNVILRTYMKSVNLDLTLVRAIFALLFIFYARSDRPLADKVPAHFVCACLALQNLHETPSNLDIEVLVLQDYGTITTEDGNVTLKKNTTVVMRRDLAEPLIKTGVLKHVNDGS